MLISILPISLLLPSLLLLNPPPNLAQPHHALIPLLVVHQLSVSAAGGADLVKQNDYWLPDNVVPVNYNISLLVNMEKLSTEGRAKIRLKVKNATDRITLHVMQERGILTVLRDQVEVYDIDNFSHHKGRVEKPESRKMGGRLPPFSANLYP